MSRSRLLKNHDEFSSIAFCSKQWCAIWNSGSGYGFFSEYFYTSAAHVSLAENLGLCHPKKVTEFGFGGDAISRCFDGLILAFFSLFIVDILTRSQFLLHPTPPSIFVCKFGQITRSIFPKSGGTYPQTPPPRGSASECSSVHSPHQSAYTASITPLKQPYCLSMITPSMPSDHRRCHAMSLPFSRFRPRPTFHLDLEFNYALSLV